MSITSLTKAGEFINSRNREQLKSMVAVVVGWGQPKALSDTGRVSDYLESARIYGLLCGDDPDKEVLGKARKFLHGIAYRYQGEERLPNWGGEA